MNQDNNQMAENGMPNCADIINQTPFWTRAVYFSMGVCWFLDLITNFPSGFIAGSVDNIFKSYKVWTIFTGSFYVDSLFFLFLIIYNFNTFLPKLEQRLSSSTLMLSFLLNGAVIQLITALIQLLFNFEDGTSPINGVEGIWFCMVFKYCYFNSQREIKFCCFPWKFKRSKYPFILLIICIILKFSIPISMIVGLLYGALQVTIQRFTTRLSARPCYTKLNTLLADNSLKCWIKYSSLIDSEDFSERMGYQNLQNFVGGGLSQTESPESTVNKDPFSDKKGVRIGDY